MFPWIVAPAADPGRDEEYAVDRCEDCGLGVTRDPPDDPAALHRTGDYASQRPRLSSAATPLLGCFDRSRLRLLRRRLSTGDVLEIGAGRGRFLGALRDAGYAARGLEPSEHRRQEALSHGVEVTGDSIEDAHVAPHSQDAVVAWHVIEHLPDPGGALARIHGWLRPDGTLLLGVPNRQSLQSALSRSHWFHLDLPRHRFHFTPDSLERLLARHGFRVERIQHVLFEHNYFGTWQTLLNGLTFNHNFLFGVLKRSLTPRSAGSRLSFAVDALVTALAALPALLVAAALELGAGLARRGGTIAVVAGAEPSGIAPEDPTHSR